MVTFKMKLLWLLTLCHSIATNEFRIIPSKYYFAIFEETNSFDQAEQYCNVFHSHLATIDTQAQWTDALSLCQSIDCWVNLISSDDGQFLWNGEYENTVSDATNTRFWYPLDHKAPNQFVYISSLRQKLLAANGDYNAPYPLCTSTTEIKLSGGQYMIRSIDSQAFTPQWTYSEASKMCKLATIANPDDLLDTFASFMELGVSNVDGVWIGNLFLGGQGDPLPDIIRTLKAYPLEYNQIQNRLKSQFIVDTDPLYTYWTTHNNDLDRLSYGFYIDMT
eukprot:19323_1